MTDEHLRLLGSVLGPTLAALVTGGALLFQASKNNRLQRDQHGAELSEARRREEAAARVEWAARFQDALAGERGTVRAWMTLIEMTNAMKDRAIREADARNRALAECVIATVRLQVADRDPIARAKSQALTQSLATTFPSKPTLEDRRRLGAEYLRRLDDIGLAFLGFLDQLAGLWTDTARYEALHKVVAESKLPQDIRQRILEE